MDFLDFSVLFLSFSSVGDLCEELNTIVVQGIWYDTFQDQNTKWLFLLNDIVITIKSDNRLCFIRALTELRSWNTVLSKTNELLCTMQ